MNQQSNQNWSVEYEEFLQADLHLVPEKAESEVLSAVLKLINPHPGFVFLKILAIHLVFGFLSLSFCHQFGINPFNTERSLSEWFMHVGGHQICMLACGIIFVGLSLLAAGFFLTIEEINSLKRTEIFQTLSIGAISLGLFAAFGAQLILSIAVLWLVGGLLGGFIATQLVWRLKQV